MTQPIDQTVQLIKSAQGGDSSALDQLLARYYERVRVIVRARMGVKIRSVLETSDILQETFCVAVKKFESFEVRDEAELIHWLGKLAERQITDAVSHAKAQKRDVDRAERLPTSSDLHPPVHAGGPLTQFAQKDQNEALGAILSEMPEEQRELVLQRLVEGGSWEDIAARLGKPSPDAARMAYGVAKAKLASRLVAAGYEPVG